MRIVLTRHGQSEDKGVLQGHMDSPLTNQGRHQARELVQRMFSSGNGIFNCICSSDLSRSAETAKIIAEILEISNIILTPLLRELDLGVFVRRPWNQI